LAGAELLATHLTTRKLFSSHPGPCTGLSGSAQVHNTRFHRAIEEYERGRFLQVKDLLSEYVSALDAAADRQSASSLTSISDTDLTDRLDDYRLYIELCSGLLRLENGDRLLKRAMEGADGELEDFTYAALLAQDEFTQVISPITSRESY
jgi:hypothetical protein